MIPTRSPAIEADLAGAVVSLPEFSSPRVSAMPHRTKHEETPPPESGLGMSEFSQGLGIVVGLLLFTAVMYYISNKPRGPEMFEPEVPVADASLSSSLPPATQLPSPEVVDTRENPPVEDKLGTGRPAPMGVVAVALDALRRTMKDDEIRFPVSSDGVVLVQVAPNSAAARAGLEEGDIILNLGSDRMQAVDDVKNWIESQRIGSTHEVVYYRIQDAERFERMTSKLTIEPQRFPMPLETQLHVGKGNLIIHGKSDVVWMPQTKIPVVHSNFFEAEYHSDGKTSNPLDDYVIVNGRAGRLELSAENSSQATIKGTSLSLRQPGQLRVIAKVVDQRFIFRIQVAEVPVAIGMSALQVEETMGEPSRTEPDVIGEWWYYDDYPGAALLMQDQMVKGVHTKPVEGPRQELDALDRLMKMYRQLPS